MVKRFSFELLLLVRYQQIVRQRNDADRTGNRKVTQLAGITDSKFKLSVVWKSHRSYCETFSSVKRERTVSERHPQKGGQKGVPKGGIKV